MSSDFDRLNPYASPAVPDPAEQPPMPRQEALRRLRQPAFGVAVCAAGGLVWIVGTLVAMGFIEFVNRAAPLSRGEWADMFGALAMCAAMVLLQVIALIGCVRLIRGRSGKWTWAAALAGLVPLGSPCACGSFVFAAWLLVLLCRKEFRVALAK
jgi:hypothetical protein